MKSILTPIMRTEPDVESFQKMGTDESKRKFMALLATTVLAAGAATALPNLGLTDESEAIIKLYTKRAGYGEIGIFDPVMETINRKLFERRPEYMKAPILDQDMQTITAFSRALSFSYGVELAQDYKVQYGEKAEEIIVEAIVKGWIEDFDEYAAKNPGRKFRMYAPIQMIRAVNPDSFQPVIGFKTRFALV